MKFIYFIIGSSVLTTTTAIPVLRAYPNALTTKNTIDKRDILSPDVEEREAVTWEADHSTHNDPGHKRGNLLPDVEERGAPSWEIEFSNPSPPHKRAEPMPGMRGSWEADHSTHNDPGHKREAASKEALHAIHADPGHPDHKREVDNTGDEY